MRQSGQFCHGSVRHSARDARRTQQPSRTASRQLPAHSPDPLLGEQKHACAENSAAASGGDDVFLEEYLGGEGIPRKVSDALAGAASESSTFERVKSSEKKLAAIDSTPQQKHGARCDSADRPAESDFARMRSRSPMRRMAPAVNTSPATAVGGDCEDGGPGLDGAA